MSINTKEVTGRRKLRFESFDDVLADAEGLVASPRTNMLGNWPLGHLLAHLGGAINGSMDGISFQAPWFVRLVAPLIKGRLFERGLSPGFRIPGNNEKRYFPETEPREALEALRAAINRTQSERMSARHPAFGKLTHEEWTKFHLRHSELHLSFALPE